MADLLDAASLPNLPSHALLDEASTSGLSARDSLLPLKPDQIQSESASSKLVIVRSPASHKRSGDLQLQALVNVEAGSGGRSTNPLYTLHQRTMHSSVILDAGTDEQIAKLSFSKTGGIEMHDLGFLGLESDPSTRTASTAPRSPSPSTSGSSAEQEYTTPIATSFFGKLRFKTRRQKKQDSCPPEPALEQADSRIKNAFRYEADTPIESIRYRRHTFNLKKSAKSSRVDAAIIWTLMPPARSRITEQPQVSTPSRLRSYSNASVASHQESLLSLPDAPYPSPNLLLPPHPLSASPSFTFFCEASESQDSPSKTRSARSVSMSASSSAGTASSSRSLHSDRNSTSSSSAGVSTTQVPQPIYAATWTCYLRFPSGDADNPDVLLATLATIQDHAQLAAKLTLSDDAAGKLSTVSPRLGYELEEIEDCVGVTALWLTAREGRAKGEMK